MTLDEYAAFVRTLAAPDRDADWHRAVYGLGLAGEAGEVCELLKKQLRDGAVISPRTLCLELGDVLFYVAALAELHGIPFEWVVNENVEKLRERYPNGFEVRT